VRVVSDEIHADFVYPGHTHHVFADVSRELRDITVTCTAPSKTFNLVGLQISNIFIPNQAMRNAFLQEYAASGLSQLGIMGMVACKAAYAGGEEWLEALKAYIWENLAFLRDFLIREIPQIGLIEPEGTYLVWLDCRGLGLSPQELDGFIVHKARLWLDDGSMFGVGGEGFQRVNIACPRSILREALERLKKAVAQI
jgi:cystathionine beta-lyase